MTSKGVEIRDEAMPEHSAAISCFIWLLTAQVSCQAHLEINSYSYLVVNAIQYTGIKFFKALQLWCRGEYPHPKMKHSTAIFPVEISLGQDLSKLEEKRDLILYKFAGMRPRKAWKAEKYNINKYTWVSRTFLKKSWKGFAHFFWLIFIKKLLLF